MTASPNTAPPHFENAEEAARALRDRGLRMSTARLLLLDALFAADGPISAVSLAHKLPIDESSVYRNLEVLKQHGLVGHLHLGHSPSLYVLSREPPTAYLYCETCSKVIALAPGHLDPLREQIKDRTGFTARFSHFAIIGTCNECAAASDSAPSNPADGHKAI